MAVYFASIGSGMGDVIVCRPACEWLIANSCEPVYLVARGPRQIGMSVLIDGLSGEVREIDLHSVLKPGDQYINLRDHPIQRYYDWSSPQFKSKYPNYRISDILDIICRDLGIKANFHDFKPFKYTIDSRTVGKVSLIPGTTMKSKMLKPSVWQKLHSTLLQRNMECAVLGLAESCKSDRTVMDLGLPLIDTSNIQQAIDAISSSRAVISVDTGLMHVAVQQGVRTIAIYGKCEVYFRPRSNCIPIFTQGTPAVPATNEELTAHHFTVSYDNWDWFPPESDEGDYLAFNDIDKLVSSLSEALAPSQSVVERSR